MKTHLISGWFMLAFLLCSAAFAGTAVWQCRGKIPVHQAGEVIRGKWASAYEASFNKGVFIYEASKNVWGALNYAAFREGNEGVLVGKDGWLFTTEEFQRQPDMEKKIQEKIDFITMVRDYLAAQNIRLVVAPVPAKARVYGGELGRYHFPAYKEAIYPRFLSDLRARNIDAVDINTPLSDAAKQEQVFLKTDTHWTPGGAEVAARTIANHIQSHGVEAGWERHPYRTIRENVLTHDGDLARYIPVGHLVAGPRPDRIEIFQTENAGADPKEDAAELLFAEETPDITLVGTSYSANPNWNFAGYLKEALQTDVLNAAKDGLGPFETMKEYLTNSAFKAAPPKLIIWEIPERYLPFDYNLDLKLDHKEA